MPIFSHYFFVSIIHLYKQIGFSNEKSYCSLKRLKKERLLLLGNKLIKNIPGWLNAKKHFESFLRKTNKICKTIRNNYLLTKNFSKPKHS